MGIHGDIVSFYQQRHTKYRYFIKYIKILWDYYEQQGWPHARKSCSNVRWANLHLNKKNIQHWAHQAWQSYFLFQSIQVTWVKIRQHLLCIYRLQHVVTKASFQLAPAQLGSTRFLGFSDQKQIVSLNPFDHVSQRSQTDCLEATFMAGFSHSVGILDDFISRVG